MTDLIEALALGITVIAACWGATILIARRDRRRQQSQRDSDLQTCWAILDATYRADA